MASHAYQQVLIVDGIPATIPLNDKTVAFGLDGKIYEPTSSGWNQIADLGGGGGAITIKSFSFDQDTVDILDPNNNGAFVLALSPGQYVEITPLWSLAPDQSGSLIPQLGTTSADQKGQGGYAGRGTGTQDAAVAVGFAWAEDGSSGLLRTSSVSTFKAISAVNLYVAFWSDATPPTAFAGELICKIYEATPV